MKMRILTVSMLIILIAISNIACDRVDDTIENTDPTEERSASDSQTHDNDYTHATNVPDSSPDETHATSEQAYITENNQATGNKASNVEENTPTDNKTHPNGNTSRPTNMPETPLDNNASVAERTVLIERVDRCVVGENGKVVGLAYYDKPVIQGDSAAARVINSYFETECRAFFAEGNKMTHNQPGRMESFLSYVEWGRDAWGDAVLEVQPFSNTVDTMVALVNENLLSVRNITYWMVGGVSRQFYYGATFDMRTGERLSIVSFIDADVGTFGDEFTNLLLDRLAATKIEYDNEKIIQLYGSLEFEDVEYYYDGDYLYIALNEGVFNDGCLLRWNGVFGENCEAVLMGYPGHSGSYEITVYSDEGG